MERHYTLAEIARITGIPLEELEQYEREFADLLPRPRCCPAASVSCAEPQPLAERAAAGRRKAGEKACAGRWQRLRRAWGVALQRVRWWPLFACGARVLLWWKKWRGGFEPA